MIHILIEEYIKKNNIRFDANFIVSQDEYSCVDDVYSKSGQFCTYPTDARDYQQNKFFDDPK
jgi:hypothetical protein